MIDYDLREAGVKMLDQAVAAASGKPVEERVVLPPQVYTADNIDDPAKQDSLQVTKCPV